MIKTIAISGITEVDFNPEENDKYFYISNPYCWIRNRALSEMYASLTDDVSAGADGTAEIPAGEAVMLVLDSENKIYISGDGSAEIYTLDKPVCPFKIAGK